jgi:hypothetical protein
MPLAKPQPQQREPEVVPVDHEPHAAAPQREPGDRERWEGRRILDEHQVRPRQLAQHPPEAKAQARRIEQASNRVARTGEDAAQPEGGWIQAVYPDPRVVGDRLGDGRSLEADQVDVEIVRRQRLRVVPHACTASEIS